MWNLKAETLSRLEVCGKTPEDIRWIGCSEFQIDIDSFWELADQEYDDGYGAQHVATDLIIVGDDWWMTRAEYDGSEWWEFNTAPVMPTEKRSVKRVVSNQAMWDNLNEMNTTEWEEEHL